MEISSSLCGYFVVNHSVIELYICIHSNSYILCYEVFEIGDAFYNHTQYLITTKTCRYEVLLLLGGDAFLFIFFDQD